MEAEAERADLQEVGVLQHHFLDRAAVDLGARPALAVADGEAVGAAVDDAVARGLADPDRLVVGGWSYGGISTNYIIATTTRFKAAVSGASASNVLAGYGTDEYIRDYDEFLTLTSAG